MSTALAVAGVTAVLRGLLENWLNDQNVNVALGGANAVVTAVAPDTIAVAGAEAGPRLNLFLHQALPNVGWRNVDLPSRDNRGGRVSSPLLALDLHYLLTAYGAQEYHPEVLLGYGMQWLHENPTLGRAEIENTLPALLRPSRLGRQLELIKVTPVTMGTEELSKLWTALQAHYRPSAAYHVSVVLIESDQRGQPALPVLTRGPIDPGTGRESGIIAEASLLPALPGITKVRPPNEQAGAAMGDVVIVDGHHLDGANRAVRLENRRLDVDLDVAAMAGAESGRIRFTVPVAPAALPVGHYELSARVRRPAEIDRRDSNRLPFTLVPDIMTPLPMNVVRDVNGRVNISLQCRPEVRPHQRVSLIIGTTEVMAEPHAASTANLTFVVDDAEPGTFLTRLRVDGIDSVVVNRAVSPPVFLNRRVTIA